MKKILVIIVTYNALRWIDRCLESLYRSSIPVDIFIVDNNSSDGTVSYIRDKYAILQLIENKKNLGFGKANNLGLKYAIDNNYDYVYLLNQDAWVFNTTIEKLISIHEQNHFWGVLSPLQINAICNRLDANFMLCCPRVMLSDYIFDNRNSVYMTDFVMAAHWLISRECLLIVGGFSPSFPHYGEDHNFLHRVSFLKFKIGIVPGAMGVHDRELRVESRELIIKKKYLKAVVEISNLNKNLLRGVLFQPINLLIYSLKVHSLKSFVNTIKLIIHLTQFISNRMRSKNYSFLDI